MDGKTDDEKPGGWLQYFNLHPRYVFPAISFIMWFVLGLYFYMHLPWGDHKHYYTFSEALYLMVQILTTVGYGDRPGPYKPTGYLFATCYVLVGVCACANLISLLVDQVRNRVGSMHTHTVGRLSQTASRMLAPAPRETSCLQDTLPGFIYNPIQRRWDDLKQVLLALFYFSFFIALGSIFYANYCESDNCIAGNCCDKWLATDSDCEYIVPMSCNTNSSRNEIGCVKRDGRFHCQIEDGSWERCHGPHRAQEASFRKGWMMAWPGQSSSEAPVPNKCSETTAICCEGKTYLMAIYMSVITLTTVGFGDVTPTTHGGMWFSVPWMLFGVASFANLVGRFSLLMLDTRQRTRMTQDLLAQLRSDPVIMACRQDRTGETREIPPSVVLRAEFILHALLQDGQVSENIADQLSQDFQTCDVNRNGWLDEDDLENLSASHQTRRETSPLLQTDSTEAEGVRQAN